MAARGHAGYGGDGVPVGLSGVKGIYSTFNAFAAPKNDGTVEARFLQAIEAMVCLRG